MTKELIYCFHCATEGHEAEDCWVGKRIADRTTIHKRPWVGLTDGEFKQIMLNTYNIDLNVPGHSSDDHMLWSAIEAKLKEKNT